MPQRIAIIGCGSIGLRHTENLLRLGKRNLLLCEPDHRRQAFLRKRFSAEVIGSLGEAFRKPVAVAFITSPTHLHLAHAEYALRHGAHLFIEKPLAHTVTPRVVELLRAAKKRRQKIFVAVNMRFHPGIALIKKLLEKKTVGRILAARVEAGFWLPDWHPGQNYRRWYMAKRALGGGVLLDGIHEIDYTTWLLGEVKNVTAVAARVSNLAIDTEDIAELLLRFQSGAIGNIHVDYLQRAYQRSIHMIGSEGTIEWQFQKPEVRVFRARTKKWKIYRFPKPDANAMYLDELRYFLRALEGKNKDRLDGRDGLRALSIAEAARRSSETGRRVRIAQP